jgi:hypothetical protein
MHLGHFSHNIEYIFWNKFSIHKLADCCNRGLAKIIKTFAIIVPGRLIFGGAFCYIAFAAILQIRISYHNNV